MGVAPQRRKRATEAMSNAGRNSAFVKLPTELLRIVSNENNGAMTRSEAEKYRDELMSERVVSVEENNEAYFGVVGPRNWAYYDG